MVHQHFMLAGAASVLDNIVIGVEPGKWGWVDRKAVTEKLQQLGAQYGLKVDWNAPVDTLPVGVQQRVELLKLLYREAKVLILDEPTAVLTPIETEQLFQNLLKLKAEGKTILLVTHKLKEVLAYADAVTVLRGGEVSGRFRAAETTADELAFAMVGRRIDRLPERPGKSSATECVLELKNVADLADANSTKLHLQNITFSVQSGEVVGIAGVEGNGQAELEMAIGGLRPVQSGSIKVCDQDITNALPRVRAAAGLSYVPSDRYGFALLRDFSVAENLVLDTFDRSPYTKHGFFRNAAIEDHAKKLVDEYGIRTPSVEAAAGRLSGGNAQKLVMARALSHQPRVLVVAQPTRGLDVGASEYVQRRLLAERARGAAIVLISTELEEILNLADRILVLYEGQSMGELSAENANAEALGLLMAGRQQ